jgi:hypothetical protein
VEHPDHALARKLTVGFLAALPRLAPDLLIELLVPADPDALAQSATAEDRRTIAQLLFGKLADAGIAATGSHRPATLRQTYRAAMDTDLFRAALGRIASAYDGGQIME